MYYPDIETFKTLTGRGNLIPVYKEIMADMETPVTAFLKINSGKYSFLLESVEGGEKWARYSFLGSDPSIIFRCRGKNVTVQNRARNKVFETRDPLSAFKEMMGIYRPVDLPELPRFAGGAVGFMGYDMVRFFEDIGERPKDDSNTDDTVFMITDTIIIFDSLKHTLKIVSCAFIDNDEEQAYAEAVGRIEGIAAKLKSPLSPPLHSPSVKTGIEPAVSKDEYLQMVVKAKEYIKAGDVFQVVLSQKFQTGLVASPFDIYRVLKLINPSPYMYYLHLDDMEIVGTSPEILVRVEGDDVEVRPIAGTRPRGKTEEEDLLLEKELLADPKERAEHIMLVDLGRNDIGRVSTAGSVAVTEMMGIERYSHVMHIVSNVRGKLIEGRDIFDVLRATFPAGTVTGAPKVRAMQIIEELESARRGPYAGCLGYIGFSGNMDMCITIRTMIIKDGVIHMQAGAGIVADSDPEMEYLETVNKVKALFRAVEVAGQGIE